MEKRAGRLKTKRGKIIIECECAGARVSLSPSGSDGDALE